MEITIQVTQEQMDRINRLAQTTMAGVTNPNPKTVQQVVYQVLEHGLYTVEYRRKQYAEQKLAKQLLKQAKTDPTLALQLGLARTESFVVVEANQEKEHRG